MSERVWRGTAGCARGELTSLIVVTESPMLTSRMDEQLLKDSFATSPAQMRVRSALTGQVLTGLMHTGLPVAAVTWAATRAAAGAVPRIRRDPREANPVQSQCRHTSPRMAHTKFQACP